MIRIVSLPLLHIAVVAATLTLVATELRADMLTGVTTGNRLVTFDSTNLGTFLTNQVITGATIIGIDRRPADGVLYGLGSTGRLYTINETTAAATQVGNPFALSGARFGFDFDPVADRIRVTSSNEQNFRLNPNDGTLTTDAALAYAVGDPNFGANGSIVGSTYTNNVPGAFATTLYGIDSTFSTLVTQDPPNAGTLHTVGPLGFPSRLDHVVFDISGANGTAFAAVTEGGAVANFSRLYTINLGTGDATLVGDITGPFAAPLVGLAAPVGVAAVPEPGSLVLVGLGAAGMAAIAWRRRRRALAARD